MTLARGAHGCPSGEKNQSIPKFICDNPRERGEGAKLFNGMAWSIRGLCQISLGARER